MGASQSNPKETEENTVMTQINQPETTQEVTVDEPDHSPDDWLWPII